MNTNEQQDNSTINEITKKILIVLSITVALLIPLLQVQCQIGDRRGFETKAQGEIAKSWGGDVTITSAMYQNATSTMFPTNVRTTVEIDTKEKKRGVFKVPVYSATLKQKISFAGATEIKRVKKDEAKQEVGQKNFLLQVSPLSAIQNYKITNAKGETIAATVASEGIKFPVLVTNEVTNSEINVEINFRGTGKIEYKTSASEDQVVFKGNWIKPQYLDNELPLESKLDSKGFNATWKLHNLPNVDGTMGENKTVGMNNLWVSSDYIMVERAVKYGILLIILTFLLIFIIEVFGKMKIHPLQYTLIGLSLCIFYLLLLAVSEVTGFDIAYLISTVAVVSLITFYFLGFVAEKRYVFWMVGEQMVLSSFFYLLLSLEERSLLIGTLGLFVVLAVLMSITRRFDWYAGVLKKN
jgi:inner membrane protein